MKKLLLLLFFVSTIVIAGIPISTNFTVNTALPIDDRMSVADTTARDAIPSLKRWEGMLVYSIADGLHYTLIGGLLNSNWTELSGGGNLVSWLTATPYEVGNTVIQSDKIYVCALNHTSGVFATDLLGGNWTELYSSKFENTKSDVDASDVNTIKLEVPNAQLTTTGLKTRRLETGNSNLLIDPSFEESTLNSAWNITNGTPTADATNQVDGKKSLSITLTGALDIHQDSTINAANLTGLQGVSEIKVKTSDISDLKVCSRNDLVIQDELCVNVVPDGTWKHVVIPFILSGTSNGIAITSTGTSGTVYLDDSFVGTSAPFQGVNGAKLVGTLKYAPTTACIWSLTSTSFSNFSADTDCATPTTLGSVKAPATKIPAVVLPSGSQAGIYYFVANGGFYHNNTSNSYAVWRFSDGVNHSTGGATYAANSMTPNIVGTINISNVLTSDTTFNIQGKIESNAMTIEATVASDGLEIAVYYFPPESKIYSQASQDYDWTSYTPTFTGFGTTSSNECFHKREGSDLLLRCKFTSGTSTATEARLSLPNSIVIDPAKVPSISMVGVSAFNVAISKGFYILGEPSSTYLTFSVQNASTGSLTKLNGSSLMASGEILSFTARVPIQGWSDYGVIVGSFAGIEKCANAYECTDTFSARISNGNGIDNENVPWLTSAVWSPSGTLTLTYKTILKDGVSTLSSAMNCTANPSNQGQRMTVNTSSSTQVIFENRANDGTSNSTPTYAYVTCQKGTNDYTPKSAKVAIVPGVYSAQVSSAGVLSKVKQTLFSGCTNANPSVCTISASSIDGTQINCGCTSLVNGAGNGISCIIDAYTSTTVAFKRFNNNTANQHDFVYNCHY